jgi:hypothetical protein
MPERETRTSQSEEFQVGSSLKGPIGINNLDYRNRMDADTSSAIAVSFVKILALGLGVHYLVIFILTFICILRHAEIESYLKPIEGIFNVWVPAVVGIVSSVVTYYFTKNHRSPAGDNSTA